MAATSRLSEESRLDFSVICRVCCSKGPGLPIFRVGLHRKVMACAAVQVWQNDGLPAQICNKCVAKLHVSFQFKRQCEKNDIYLRRCRDTEKYIESKKKENVDKKLSSIEPVSQGMQTEDSEAPVPLPLTTDCGFPNCTLSPLNDTHHFESLQNMIATVDAARLDSQSDYNGSDILESVPDVDISIKDLSENYSQSLDGISFDSQVLAEAVSINEQMLNLDSLSVTSQIQPIITHDAQTFNLDVISIPDDNTDIKDAEVIKNLNSKSYNNNENCEIFHCPVCNKIFTSLSKLNRHNRTHSDEILYRCDICNKGFIHGGNFKVHLRMHSDERPFSCTVCHKSCRQRQDLEKHMRIHTGIRPHVCSICQKAFTTSSNLVAHERTHSGEKPYVCTVCQKAFCQSGELSKHFRTHTGEKSHICPVCDKGFNGSSTLVVHMRIHTGEKPYVCTICNKGFTQSSCLAAHSRMHIKSREHQCKRCPRLFSNAKDLKTHMAAHPPANFSCAIPGCVRFFFRHNDLLRHIKLYHGKQNNTKRR